MISMYPKTERALRFSFGFFGSLYGIIALGQVAQIALVLIQKPNARLVDFSGMFLSHVLFMLLVTSSFGYVVVRFYHLLDQSPRVMERVLHFNFLGQIAFLIIGGGGQANPLGGIIAAVVYASLLIGVRKLK